MGKILILGASGFLGTKLFEIFSNENEVIGTYFGKSIKGLVRCDVTEAGNVRKVIKDSKPDVVINTVAVPDPDVCEQNRVAAEKINFLGTKNVVDICKEMGIRLDYISTVYVFDGQKGDYVEEDKPNPINWYGETKLKAEREVITLSEYGIYRFDKIYGYNGKGKPNDLLSKILSGKRIRANSDQLRQPLFVDDVGDAIKIVQRSRKSGIFHLAGPDRVSKYELVVKLARLVGRESLVVPIKEEGQIARRPRDTSVKTTKVESLGGTFTSIKEAIRLIKKNLIKEGEIT